LQRADFDQSTSGAQAQDWKALPQNTFCRLL
jgi:hypothetical protein